MTLGRLSDIADGRSDLDLAHPLLLPHVRRLVPHREVALGHLERHALLGAGLERNLCKRFELPGGLVGVGWERDVELRYRGAVTAARVGDGDVCGVAPVPLKVGETAAKSVTLELVKLLAEARTRKRRRCTRQAHRTK